jgi:hypothetical protein
MNESLFQTQLENRTRYRLRCDRLPLAVYCEVVSHLRQVLNVEVGLLPQLSQQFDYMQSQVGGLWIEYTSTANATDQERVKQILDYYGDRYGSWEEWE